MKNGKRFTMPPNGVGVDFMQAKWEEMFGVKEEVKVKKSWKKSRTKIKLRYQKLINRKENESEKGCQRGSFCSKDQQNYEQSARKENQKDLKEDQKHENYYKVKSRD